MLSWVLSLVLSMVLLRFQTEPDTDLNTELRPDDIHYQHMGSLVYILRVVLTGRQIVAIDGLF